MWAPGLRWLEPSQASVSQHDQFDLFRNDPAARLLALSVDSKSLKPIRFSDLSRLSRGMTIGSE